MGFMYSVGADTVTVVPSAPVAPRVTSLGKSGFDITSVQQVQNVRSILSIKVTALEKHASSEKRQVLVAEIISVSRGEKSLVGRSVKVDVPMEDYSGFSPNSPRPPPVFEVGETVTVFLSVADVVGNAYFQVGVVGK